MLITTRSLVYPQAYDNANLIMFTSDVISLPSVGGQPGAFASSRPHVATGPELRISMSTPHPHLMAAFRLALGAAIASYDDRHEYVGEDTYMLLRLSL